MDPAPEIARSFTLRWSDADANGHVRHTVYSELGVESRMAFLRAGGFGWTEMEAAGIGPVLLREDLEYLRELTIDEQVRVDLRVAAASADGGRWRIRHQVTKASGELAARVTVTGGWIDLHARRLTHPPAGLVALFANAPRTDDFEELKPLRR
jgi:acyl-CoA thioester hydrolase